MPWFLQLRPLPVCRMPDVFPFVLPLLLFYYTGFIFFRFKLYPVLQCSCLFMPRSLFKSFPSGSRTFCIIFFPKGMVFLPVPTILLPPVLFLQTPSRLPPAGQPMDYTDKRLSGSFLCYVIRKYADHVFLSQFFCLRCNACRFVADDQLMHLRIKFPVVS